jgi:voltage-gated potassium channel
MYQVIFGTDTKAGRNFDVILLILIGLSVFLVMAESVPSIRDQYEELLVLLEWAFTILFTIEYIIRLAVSPNPVRYVFSFWGVIDLMSILPTYLLAFNFGYQSLRIVRALRLIRIFRILKLHRFISESQALYHALRASYYRIVVFLVFVFLLTIVCGTIMYVIEDGQNGFSSIPSSIYWAIVTITTVGFGDIIPSTALGQFLASVMMILGYAIIALPTGLITMEMSKFQKGEKKNVCPHCEHENPSSSNYCNECGDKISHN